MKPPLIKAAEETLAAARFPWSPLAQPEAEPAKAGAASYIQTIKTPFSVKLPASAAVAPSPQIPVNHDKAQTAAQVLATHIRDVEAVIEDAKVELAEAQTQLKALVETDFKTQLRIKGKEHGEMVLLVDDVKIKAAIGRTVKWDGDALKVLCMRLNAAQKKELFKYTLTVSEDAFKAAPVTLDADQYDELKAARTVTYSPLSAKLAD